MKQLVCSHQSSTILTETLRIAEVILGKVKLVDFTISSGAYLWGNVLAYLPMEDGGVKMEMVEISSEIQLVGAYGKVPMQGVNQYFRVTRSGELQKGYLVRFLDDGTIEAKCGSSNWIRGTSANDRWSIPISLDQAQKGALTFDI